MLKINIYVRSTYEYSRYSIDVNPNLSQEEFEEQHAESDDCFMGDVYETCPYFYEGSNYINVYIGGDPSYVKYGEKSIFTSENFEDFALEKGGSLNYVPEQPEQLNTANVWYSHDMKHNQTFFWNNVDSFDPKKLVVRYGLDQEGKKYFENFEYDGEFPDDFCDQGDTGYGYDGPYFIYHPEQKFKEEVE
jgi:hypothetical protein